MKRFAVRYWYIIILCGIVAFFAVKPLVQSKIGKAKNGGKTYVVTRKNLKEILTLTGSVDANEKAILHFQTGGRLSWVGVKVGDTVKAYQAVASLDTRDVQKTLEKTLRDYSKTRNDFEETWRVTYIGKLPKDALNDTMKRILEKNQWDLERAVLDVELKALAVEYATLTTPIAGIVTRIDTPIAGVNITASQGEFEVVNPASVYLSVLADQSEAYKLKEGMTADITFDAFPDQTYQGTISSISFTPKEGESSTVYEVKVVLLNGNPDYIFRLSLTADATFTLSEKPNTLVIPSSFVITKNDTSYVKKTVYRKVETVPVTLGVEYGDDREVVSGVSEGDVVHD